jgi:hypothetical protein
MQLVRFRTYTWHHIVSVFYKQATVAYRCTLESKKATFVHQVLNMNLEVCILHACHAVGTKGRTAGKTYILRRKHILPLNDSRE